MSLLDKASLIVTPNAYKESKLYSVVPSSGAGDMDVVRATTATRVNSAGLIEVVPRNLFTYSQQFENSDWQKLNDGTGTIPVVTSNYTTAPNGTNTAERIQFSKGSGTTGSDYSIIIQTGLTLNQTGTLSIYLKSLTGATQNVVMYWAAGQGQVVQVTSQWQRFTLNSLAAATSGVAFGTRGGSGSFFNGGDNSLDIAVWGAQLEASSTATEYFPTTTRLNIPRIDYTNGSCPSLLVEPQRSNLLTYSQQFDDSSWVKVNANVTANSTISPDGTQNADTLSSIIAAENSVTKSLAISINTTYTFSVYIKKDNNESRFPEIILRTEGVSYVEQYVQLNTKTGATNIRYQNGTVSHKVESLGNYWKVILTNVGLLDTLIIARIRPAVTDVFGTYNPQIGSVIAYGSQLEAGSYQTSYIPTVASSVTRNADVISKTGISSLIGQTEGTIFVDANISTRSNTRVLLDVQDGTNNDVFQFVLSGNTLTVNIFDNGTLQASLNGGTCLGRKKIALGYKLNDFILYIDGVQVYADTSGTVPSTSLIALGFLYIASGYELGDSINSTQLYKTRLTNSELASLTTI